MLAVKMGEKGGGKEGKRGMGLIFAKRRNFWGGGRGRRPSFLLNLEQGTGTATFATNIGRTSEISPRYFEVKLLLKSQLCLISTSEFYPTMGKRTDRYLDAPSSTTISRQYIDRGPHERIQVLETHTHLLMAKLVHLSFICFYRLSFHSISRSWDVCWHSSPQFLFQLRPINF